MPFLQDTAVVILRSAINIKSLCTLVKGKVDVISC